MSRYELVVSQPHAESLRRCLFPLNGYEAGAIVLCGVADIPVCPWTGEHTRRYLSREIIPIPQEDVVSSSSRNFEWRKATFLNAYSRARKQNLAIGFIHSHRMIQAFFSSVDDVNDHDLAELVSHRQSPRPDLLSIVFDETGGAVARRCLSADELPIFDKIGVLERSRWSWTYSNLGTPDDGSFDRQALAFGPDFFKILRHLRISVIGAGATGSATLQLLTRLGARYLAAIDPEIVEISNPTRIHGSRKDDAIHAIPKVDVARRAIEESGFEVDLRTYQTFVTSPDVREVLKASDLIFGCTDDDEGRLFLNRFAFFYNTPLIDMGIKIDPTRVRDSHVRLADGRVTVVAPGSHCLVCRRIADPVRARDEYLKRTDPEAYGERLAEGYIATEFITAPSVITLTTAVACMAVDEMTARLTAYRTPVDHWLRKFVPKKDYTPGPSCNQCGVCSDESWGRGDVTPFLNRVG